MNKEAIKQFFRNKTVRVVTVCLAALLLLIAVWRVFFTASDGVGLANGYLPTEREARLAVLLSSIEGVETVTVMIGEENGAPVNAVVVIGGEDGFVTRMRVIKATANALSIDPNRVLVYPA